METILIKGANWLGDAVMSLPSLRGLRDMFPRSKITVLTRQEIAQLYETISSVDDVIHYSSWWEAVKKVRHRKFDACLVFPRSLKSALIPFLGRVPKRVGYGGLARTKKTLTVHRVHYFYNLLHGFGQPPLPRPPALEVPLKYQEWAARQVDTSQLIGLHPGASYGNAKQWNRERFVETGRRLMRGLGRTIAIFGGPSETALGSEIASQIGGNAINFAGKTNLLELMALIARCQLFVTNDTGPMHVADAMGIPIVAIFGPTDPTTTRPFGSRHRLIRHELACSPCLERSCPLKHHDCMKSVTVDEVYDACLQMLGEPL